jgi:integrase
VIPGMGAASIGAIAQLDVQAWVNELAAKDLSASTVRQSYQLFERVMSAAVLGGLIPASPCQAIHLPRAERREMHFLSADQVRALSGASGEFSTLVYSAAYTGLRWGELVGLKIGRLHMLRGEIEVAEQLTEVAGHLSFKAPKAKSSRIIGMPSFLVEMLARHLEGRTADPGALVFVGRDGAALRRSNFGKRYWKPAVARVGLPSTLRFHDLRHTCVAFLIDVGMQQYDVMRHLGHASIRTTIDVYGHKFPNRDGALRAGLNETYERSLAASPRPGQDADVVELSRQVL